MSDLDPTQVLHHHHQGESFIVHEGSGEKHFQPADAPPRMTPTPSKQQRKLSHWWEGRRVGRFVRQDSQ